MKLEGKTIMLTGGAGFIGSHIVERLGSKNKIVVFDNFRSDSLKYLSHEPDDLVKMHGDILDVAGMRKAFEGGIDIVVHLAAIAGVVNILKDPLRTFDVDMLGTYNVIKMSSEYGVERFVDFSTSEVYGSEANNVSEDDRLAVESVKDGRWAYAISKIAGELLTQMYFQRGALKTTTIRPFNIYGPRQLTRSAIVAFTQDAIAGKDIVVNNDGSAMRSWCNVSDFVDGLVLALESEKAVGEIFNIGNSLEPISVIDLARKIINLSGADSKIVFKKPDFPDVQNRSPDIGKAMRMLGYSPKVGLDEGLRGIIEWNRANVARS
jgi:nucleoside-diphosphate-sugar epimerase